MKIPSRRIPNQPDSEAHTLAVDERLSWTLSRVSRASSLKTSGLQRGLVPLIESEDLAEEGLGFGVPVVVYGTTVFFSSSSRVRLVTEQRGRWVLEKTFCMDAVSRKRLKAGKVDFNISPVYDLLSGVIGAVERLYQQNRVFRLIMTGNMSLQARLGITRSYERVKPRGEVAVTYEISGRLIRITVQLGSLTESWQKVCLLNELGATYFTRYADSKGRQLCNDEIGAWEKVNAEWARISTPRGDFAFTLKSVDGTQLFRGREAVRGLLAWAGLSYELGPGASSLGYDVELVSRGSS